MIASKRGFNLSPASLSVPCLRLLVSAASASASDYGAASAILCNDVA